MTDARLPTDWQSAAMQKRIRQRYVSERNFKFLGLFAVTLSAGFLAFLIVTMAWSGARGFTRSNVDVPFDFPALAIPLSPAALTGGGDVDSQFAAADLPGAVTRATEAAFGAGSSTVVSDSGWLALRAAIKRDPSILTRKATISIPASAALDIA
jgi:phosphate transport system permease protein